MILTTTNEIQNYPVRAYKGIVFGEVLTGVNWAKDLSAAFTSPFGVRSSDYEEQLIEARHKALRELESRAMSIGANAVIGVAFDLEILGTSNNIMMVTCSGTAVVI